MIRLVFILLVVSLTGYVAFGGQAYIQERLAASRQKIDKIDRQIVDLINQRAGVVAEIGKIKSAGGLPITAPHREEEVLRRVADIGAAGPMPTARLNKIYSILLEQMREWEEEQQQPKR